jgi:hypothetical protein
MELSKTTEEGVEVLLVDRTDEGTPEATQTFTKAELEDIRINTLNHQIALEAVKEERPEEWAYYLQPDENGKSVIERALEEHDILLTKCDELNITK